jgi:hypothetical protein
LHIFSPFNLFFNTPILAEELGVDDVPGAFTGICAPTVELIGICDIDPNEAENETENRNKEIDADEAIEAPCVTSASFGFTQCALCADDDIDMTKIMSQCSFSSTSYAPLLQHLSAELAFPQRRLQPS